jgi:hypothetical protein
MYFLRMPNTMKIQKQHSRTQTHTWSSVLPWSTYCTPMSTGKLSTCKLNEERWRISTPWQVCQFHWGQSSANLAHKSVKAINAVYKFRFIVSTTILSRLDGLNTPAELTPHRAHGMERLSNSIPNSIQKRKHTLTCSRDSSSFSSTWSCAEQGK